MQGRTAVQCCAGIWMLAGGVFGFAQSGGPVVHTASIHLDPARTQITFTAGSLRHVHGSLQLKEGVFAVDTASGVAQGEILADAMSEKSSNKGMDRKIQTGTLDANTYPGIFFHPEKVSGQLPPRDGSSQLKLAGVLTIHGQDHPLSVEVNATRKGPDLLFKTAFTIPYVQWGMKDASSFLMHARDVRVTMVSHGTLEAPKA